MSDEKKEKTTEVNEKMDTMRSDFYHTSKNLFEAAKYLKKYDLFYTDSLLQQAQYFLRLADNYDTLKTFAEMNSEMPLTKLQSKIPEEVMTQIDNYATTLKKRFKGKKAEDVSEEVTESIEAIAKDVKEKL